MIFIAVGTQKFQINRLLKAVDQLMEQGMIQEPVFAQIGNSDYEPKHYSYERFLDKETFEKNIETCNMLITHGGVGTIIAGLQQHRPIIVFPRLAKYGEHVDDHQLQIADSFGKMNYVLTCHDEQKLAETIKKSQKHTFAEYVSQRGKMLALVGDYLKTL